MTISPRRDTDVTRVHEWKDGRVEARQDDLAAEEPLEIRIDGRPLTVTMRTPAGLSIRKLEWPRKVIETPPSGTPPASSSGPCLNCPPM